MALREFTDKRGVNWRVWDITPESLRMLTGRTGYPGAGQPEAYRTGWLAFQTLSGADKRWLAPIPPGWESLPTPALVELLERASPVAPRGPKRADAARPSQPSVPVQATADELSEHEATVRAFAYPGGRAWTVSVVSPERGGGPVLRFTSGGRSLDLGEWPADWADLPDEALCVLLRRVPRTGPPPGPGTPRRRWNDPQP